VNARYTSREADERGAALILAIAFMVLVGVIGAALLGATTSGLHNRQALERTRDKEYAADAAIESAITQVRTLAAPGPALHTCGPYPLAAGSVSAGAPAIQVDCAGVPTLTIRGLLQRNVLFTSCLQSDVDTATGTCKPSSVIIRALVNFETSGSGSAIVVTHTTVQTWSVNG
jgi:Tfp pilus assembly protein PilX